MASTDQDPMPMGNLSGGSPPATPTASPPQETASATTSQPAASATTTKEAAMKAEFWSFVKLAAAVVIGVLIVDFVRSGGIPYKVVRADVGTPAVTTPPPAVGQPTPDQPTAKQEVDPVAEPFHKAAPKDYSLTDLKIPGNAREACAKRGGTIVPDRESERTDPRTGKITGRNKCSVD